MNIPTIQPELAFRACEEDASIQLLDVRTPAEFEQLHARGARTLPLDRLDDVAVRGVMGTAGEKPVYVICKSGARAAKAAEAFIKAGCKNVSSIAGGTEGWQRSGLPVVKGVRRAISLERQVRIGAGALVVLGVLLGVLVHPALLGLSAFVGAGLVFAGITDWCGMGLLLAKMPWNR
ncbi:rhodanese-like domain-containing protein [Humisphaera borealis]|uniref:Rhodanese-like domain-containing protein n=1 Tax=Humisphaera borealis TaxID=2807512 RepID=A0A7M2WUL1_9BACT|nr:rhodanese-like domain-containing protein [Humisphaera borealis]QOV89215.1 rhodanese-like domain-containing protein [Humisphaera borealis]